MEDHEDNVSHCAVDAKRVKVQMELQRLEEGSEDKSMVAQRNCAQMASSNFVECSTATRFDASLHSAPCQDLDANDKQGMSDYELQPGADVSLDDLFAIASPNYLGANGVLTPDRMSVLLTNLLCAICKYIFN